MRADKLIKYIEENLENDINLDTLALENGYSKYHFSRLFNRTFGISINEYIKRRRLTKAVLLLDSGSRTVTEISMICGYNSNAYFSKHFREEFNLSPKQYLKEDCFLYLLQEIKIGDKKMFTTIQEQINYVLSSYNDYEDLISLFATMEQTVLVKKDQFTIEYITTTQVKAKKGQHYDGHIIWEVSLNLLNGTCDYYVIRNTSFLRNIDLTALYKDGEEIIVESKNSLTNESFKSRLVEDKRRQYQLDFYNFGEDALEKSKEIENTADSYSIEKLTAKISDLVFKSKNSIDYINTINNSTVLYSFCFMKTIDLIGLMIDDISNKYSLFVTAIVNLNTREVMDVRKTKLPNYGKSLILEKVEDNHYNIKNGDKFIVDFKVIRGQDLKLYNSKYRIKNDNNHSDLY